MEGYLSGALTPPPTAHHPLIYSETENFPLHLGISYFKLGNKINSHRYAIRQHAVAGTLHYVGDYLLQQFTWLGQI